MLIFFSNSLFADDDILSTGPTSFKIEFVRPCLPELDADNKIFWEEKTQSGLIRGESSFRISPPPKSDGYEIKLPKNPGLKVFSINVKLFGGDTLSCKFDPLKTLKIDRKDILLLQKTRKCECMQ